MEARSEEHTSELQSHSDLVCRLLLEKKKIKEMTRKVSAEVELVHQQTQNQRYGSSHIGATAKDITNIVTDSSSGVSDYVHGMDNAVYLLHHHTESHRYCSSYLCSTYNDISNVLTYVASGFVDIFHCIYNAVFYI